MFRETPHAEDNETSWVTVAVFGASNAADCGCFQQRLTPSSLTRPLRRQPAEKFIIATG